MRLADVGLLALAAAASLSPAAIASPMPLPPPRASPDVAASVMPTRQPEELVPLLKLSSENWTSSISTGAWLIEFYSPYCSPCKAFLPVWQEIATTKEHLGSWYPGAPFRLAQVDCHAERDICVEQGVRQLPRLTVYKDGLQQEGEYQGDREYTDLSAFVESQADQYRRFKGVRKMTAPPNTGSVATETAAPAGAAPAPPPTPPEPQPASQPGQPQDVQPPPPQPPVRFDNAPIPSAQPVPPKPIDEAEQAKLAALEATLPKDGDTRPHKFADPIVPQEPKIDGNPFRPNKEGRVYRYGQAPIANAKALANFLGSNAEPSYGATFVKFFAPWCPHCRAMASAFEQVAKDLQGKVNVVEVDCESFRLVCRDYRVQSFPTLRMYNDGEANEYTGARSASAMRDWAMKAGSDASLHQIAPADLDRILSSDEVAFVYLHSEEVAEKEKNAVQQASRSLLTTPVHLYSSTDPALLERFHSFLRRSKHSSGGMSALLCFKDFNATRPISAFYPGSLSTEALEAKKQTDIEDWLALERFPTVTEISGSTFADVINNRAGVPVVMAVLSGLNHGGSQLSTGVGAMARDAELEAFVNASKLWRSAGKSSAESAKEHKAIFAWIDADRWASALRKYYKVRPEQLPRVLLVDGPRMDYFVLPTTDISALKAVSLRSNTATQVSAIAARWINVERLFSSVIDIFHGRGPKAQSSRTALDRGMRGANGLVEALVSFGSDHPLLSLAMLLGLIAGIVSYMRRAIANASSSTGSLSGLGTAGSRYPKAD